MKILFINTGDNRGGAARLVMDLKDGLDKYGGFETSLFVKEKYSNDPSVFLVKKGNKFLKKIQEVIGVDLASIWHNKWHYLLSNDLEFFNNKNLLESKELEEADIVHCHNLHNSYFNLKNLEKISKEKLVIWSLHDMWALTPHEAWQITDESGKTIFEMEVKPNLLWNNRRHLLETKSKVYENTKLNIVSTSAWFENQVKKSILRGHTLHLIYNGIDEEIFKKRDKAESRRELGLPLDKKIVTFMASGGKHNKQKGWKYAEAVINHFRDREDVVFLCIGGKNNGGEEKSDNVIYVPYIDDEMRFALYYNASDAFFNPSEAEAFCLVLVQALSSEIPAVTFPTGIAEEAVEHKKNGYMAKYQDARDLINGVEYALSRSTAELEEMGRSARKVVLEKFTKRKMVENYINLYKSLLKK